MQDAFKLALDRTPRRCLGLDLQPLTLGHLFLLQRFQSPFIQGGDVALGDVLLAAFICAQPHRNSGRDLDRWWTKHWLRFWVWRSRKLNWAVQADEFDQYLSDNLPRLEYWKKGDGKPAGSPYCFFLLAMAMARLHLNRDEALDMPVAELICLLASAAEVEGDVQLCSDDDMEFFEWAKDQDRLRAQTAQNAKN